MKLELPSGTSALDFSRALKSFASVVGEQWVLQSDLDRETYLDAYAVGDGRFDDARRFARAAPVVGMTNYADLVLVRGLAAPFGLRLQFHATHTRRSAIDVRHQTLVPGNHSAAALQYAVRAENWVDAIAQQLLNEARSRRRCGAATVNAAPCTLHSWLLEGALRCAGVMALGRADTRANLGATVATALWTADHDPAYP
jgi:hypothetical protein